MENRLGVGTIAPATAGTPNLCRLQKATTIGDSPHPLDD